MTEEEKKDGRKYYAKEFGIPVEDIIWGKVGICYGTIVVKTRESAKKISKKVKAEGRTANGGFMHGMLLGSITEYEDEFRVTH